MGWGSLFVSGIAVACAGWAAAGSAWAASACRLEAAGAGTVAAVSDGRSFVLDDGRQIRLAAIEVPQLPLPGETGSKAAAALAARGVLESMVLGQKIELRQKVGAATDRYGRILAFAYVEAGGERSVAHDLVGRGHALVAIHGGERACTGDLLAQERAARDAKLGLWGEPVYWLMGAEGAAALLAERGQFTVVEGKVLSVRESGGTIYMNFGRRWSQALTVTIPKRQERTFAAAGIAPKQLENRRVRVRGWIEERNGPRIEALRPDQIEVAERN